MNNDTNLIFQQTKQKFELVNNLLLTKDSEKLSMNSDA